MLSPFELWLGSSGLLLLVPGRLRFVPAVMTFGIAGWLLPANLATLGPPMEQSRVIEQFSVQSIPENFGGRCKQWIKLNQNSLFRTGLLYSNCDDQLLLGASYSALVELTPNLELSRADFTSRMLSKPRLVSTGSAWESFLDSARQGLLSRIQGTSQDSIGLVLGMSIGDRSGLSPEFSNVMKNLSLTHIVAVSGANLAIVMGLAYFVSRLTGIPRLLRFVLASVTAILYSAIVGPQPSVLRALFMAHVVLVCLVFGRKSMALIAICWAAMLLLAFDPYLAKDFGFLLSVFATVGILLLARPLQQALLARLPSWLAAGIGVSASAQLFTTPILVLLQPGVPTYSVLANLLVMPLIAPVTILGLLAFVSQPLPLATEGLTWLASLPAQLLVELAGLLAQLPNLRFAWIPGFLGTITAAAVAASVTVGFLWHRVKVHALITAVLLALGSWLCGTHLAMLAGPIRDWSVIACDVGQGDALLIRDGSSFALIDVGPDVRAIADCLERAGVTTVDLLVLTHFDRDHVAGLGGVLDCCSISRVLLPDFEDSRELALDSIAALQSQGMTQIERVSSGQSGILGGMKWKVLSPGSIESASGDSNESSITMFFESPKFRLLALADAPASVQDRVADRFAYLLDESSLPSFIKVSHHGAADQSSRLLAQLRPDVAIISAGLDNRYGHPAPSTLATLAKLQVRVFRTDLLGLISLRADNGIVYSGSE